MRYARNTRSGFPNNSMNIIKGLTLFGDIDTVIEHSKLETKEKIMKVHTKKKKKKNYGCLAGARLFIYRGVDQLERATKQD